MECSWRLWPTPGDVGADLDAAGEPHAGHLAQRRVGLLGGGREDAVHTPRRWGAPLSAGVLVLDCLDARPLRTSCSIVGTRDLWAIRDLLAGTAGRGVRENAPHEQAMLELRALRATVVAGDRRRRGGVTAPASSWPSPSTPGSVPSPLGETPRVGRRRRRAPHRRGAPGVGEVPEAGSTEPVAPHRPTPAGPPTSRSHAARSSVSSSSP